MLTYVVFLSINDGETLHLCTIHSSLYLKIMDELPIQCMKHSEKNNYNLQISPNNKLLTNTDNIDSMQICPSKAWDYFIWSVKEWWLIYVFILLIGVVIGSLIIALIIYCYWRYFKKDKFSQQIIDDYNRSAFDIHIFIVQNNSFKQNTMNKQQ